MKSDPLWHPPQLAIVRMPPGSGQDQVDLSSDTSPAFTPPTPHIINVMPPLRRVNGSCCRKASRLDLSYVGFRAERAPFWCFGARGKLSLGSWPRSIRKFHDIVAVHADVTTRNHSCLHAGVARLLWNCFNWPQHPICNQSVGGN